MEKIIETINELESLRGVPQFLFFSPIFPETAVHLRKKIIDFKNNYNNTSEIDFIINSPGGSPADAYRIIRSLRNNFDQVNVIVPFWAKSAATLLSLGANQIIMDEYGEFGPLDIQIGVEREDSPDFDIESALNDEYSVRRIETRSQELYYEMFVNLYSNREIKINKNDLSNQILKYLAHFYEPLLNQINPYNLGRKKRKLDIGENYAKRILYTYNKQINDDDVLKLVDFLVNGCPDHGYVIDYFVMSQFMSNILKTVEISEKYANKVSELTTEIINLKNDKIYVDFITSSSNENNNLKYVTSKNVNKSKIKQDETNNESQPKK